MNECSWNKHNNTVHVEGDACVMSHTCSCPVSGLLLLVAFSWIFAACP